MTTLPFMSLLQNEIYDIGTEILNFQCLNCLQTRLFCKSIFFAQIAAFFAYYNLAVSKHDLKQCLKNHCFSLQMDYVPNFIDLS